MTNLYYKQDSQIHLEGSNYLTNKIQFIILILRVSGVSWLHDKLLMLTSTSSTAY